MSRIIQRSSILCVFMLFLFVFPVFASPVTICIDPGHGGIDSGAVGPTGLMEKDVNLAVAIATAKILKENPGLNIYLTRAEDKTVELQERCDLANDINATIFVSLHCDSYTDPAARGTTAYTYMFGGEGEKLARFIHVETLKIPNTVDGGVFSATGILKLPDHGLKEGNFKVLRDTNMPASLIEMSFISNPQEELLLSDKNFQQQMAQAVADGIINYLGIENKTYHMGKPAINYNGTTYVPLSAFLTTLGSGKVIKWDPSNQIVTIEKDGKVYELQIGSDAVKEAA